MGVDKRHAGSKWQRTAQVAALLLGGQLVLEVHARSAGLDHGLRQTRHIRMLGRDKLNFSW